MKDYALTKNRIVVLKGNAQQMRHQFKKTSGIAGGYELWFSPSSKVGDKMKRFHE